MLILLNQAVVAFGSDSSSVTVPDVNQIRTPANVAINGATLRHLRILNGLGVTALANELECSPAYVSRMESGRAKRVSPAMFAKLRTTLAVTDPRVLMANPDLRPVAESAAA